MNKMIDSSIYENGMKLPEQRLPVTIGVRRCREGEICEERGEEHRIIGLCEGKASVEGRTWPEAVLELGQLAFLPRNTEYTVRALDGAVLVTYGFAGKLPVDTAALFGTLTASEREEPAWTPVLGPDSRLLESLRATVALEELTYSGKFCELRATELILTAGLCRKTREMAHWLLPLLHARDNFEEFVRANYHRAQGVTELAQLAGMGLSTFKRKFAQVFGTSVYQWMMKQKAMGIREQIGRGNGDIQDLMARFGFHYHSHFNRFCHMYLGAAPSRLVQKITTETQTVNEPNRGL